MVEPTAPAPPLTAAAVSAWRDELLSGGLPTGRALGDDVERVGLLEALTLLGRAATAVQGELALGLDASQRSQQAAAGVPAGQRGRGVAVQVALARRESPHRAQVFLAAAKALRAELPHTRHALATGVIDEHAATLLVRETACLSAGDRRRVDEETCADHETLLGVGTRRLVAAVRRRAETLDPAAAVRRARRAETERHVSLRPAPDTMAYLTALVPMTQGVAAYAALHRDAQSAVSTGAAAGRSPGQVAADLLVSRLTGQASAEQVPVEVVVVMSDASLFGAGAEPAVLVDRGAGGDAIPAQVARELAARAVEADAAWVRRLYARPDGELVALTSRQRFVRGGLADYLRARDQGLCRTPWCDAPARHDDHTLPVAEGGLTTAHDTQGLCAACNHAKQAPAGTRDPGPGPDPTP